MSIPDALIVDYLEVYTDVPMETVSALRGNMDRPYEAKKLLAEQLVRRYHGEDAGVAERKWWDQTFSDRKTPDEVVEVNIAGRATLMEVIESVLSQLSRSEIRRLAKQGAIRCDEERVDEPGLGQSPAQWAGKILKVGKRNWLKLSGGR